MRAGLQKYLLHRGCFTYKESKKVITKVAALKVLSLASGVGAVAFALAVPTKTVRADAGRCTGMTKPLCSSTQVCVTIGVAKVCHTENYYFPDPQ